MNKYLRDFDSGPWCWQEKKALRLIRSEFEKRPKCLTTCLAIYTCLTELASNKSSSDTFPAYNLTIANMAGKSISTIKTYCNALISLGLLSKKTTKRGKQNLANKWYLLQAPDTPVSNNYPTSDTNNDPTSGNNNPPVLEENNKEENLCRNQPALKIYEGDIYKRFEKFAMV